jgi:hydroxymethylpyrimidine pyrophosphatase-like HAD family hydrolase
MKIAVEFDGTIVENDYPKIGEAKPQAFEVLKWLQASGHEIILWTTRSGKQLKEAIQYCSKNDLLFYAVNKNHNESCSQNAGSKIQADLFIDHKNIGGITNWVEMYWMIQLQMIS